MNDVLTIPKDVSRSYGPDYDMLREAGLHYIEKLSGKIWTDYNAHDPGVTILELLCWVITDLGYRIAMPVEDIVAEKENNLQNMHEQFLSALHILPAAPVTANDYRKLFVRIDGVNNAWMQKAGQSIIVNYANQPPQMRYPVNNGDIPLTGKELSFNLNGLYNILLDVDESKKNQLDDIKLQVKKVYHHFRNLCEDIVEINEVKAQEITVCAEVELEAKADPEKVWAIIINAIEQYLSPGIHFYSLQQMLEKKIPSEEIFEGPVFDFDAIPFTDNAEQNKNTFSKKGFIDDAEIKQSSLRKEIRLSDIIRVITKIPGVKLVKSISFGFCSCNNIGNESHIPDKSTWILCMKDGHKPELCRTSTVINFYKDVIPIELKIAEANAELDELERQQRISKEIHKAGDLPMPLGRYRSIKEYSTVQNHLPETYGIGEAGLPDTAAVQRKSSAKQLKAYLLFFDQVLANYFSQLANVKLLLSASDDPKKTYFHNVVKGIKEANDIFPEDNKWEESVDRMVKETKLDNYVVRKNKLVDHLLARFAEQFSEYVFLLHTIYGADHDFAIIRHKLNFYKDYENMSTYRADGFDYYNKKTVAESLVNVSGMEKRLSRLLGFNNYKREKLSALAYKVFKTDPADPFSNYSWTIQNGTTDILRGTGSTSKQVDAYQQMSLASILGCDIENYRYLLSNDKKRVAIAIVNSAEQVIALSFGDFEVLPGEEKKEDYMNAKNAAIDLINYFRNDFKLEGMYVVEHILLRPSVKPLAPKTFMPVCIDTNAIYCRPLDPYSFRIAVILPGYSMRLRNKDFRRYAERMIRLETPAHILPRICFIGIDQMLEFETVYEEWLNKKLDPAGNNAELQDPNEKLIDLLERLFTVYEQGQLADCDDDTVERNPIILGRTNLGTLESPS